MKIAAIVALVLLAACETPVSDSLAPDEFNIWYALTDSEYDGGLARTNGTLALDSLGTGESSTFGFGFTFYLSAPTIPDRQREMKSFMAQLDARDARAAKLKAQAEAAAKDAHAEHEGPALPPSDEGGNSERLIQQLWFQLTGAVTVLLSIVGAYLKHRMGHSAAAAGAIIPDDDVGD